MKEQQALYCICKVVLLLLKNVRYHYRWVGNGLNRKWRKEMRGCISVNRPSLSWGILCFLFIVGHPVFLVYRGPSCVSCLSWVILCFLFIVGHPVFLVYPGPSCVSCLSWVICVSCLTWAILCFLFIVGHPVFLVYRGPFCVSCLSWARLCFLLRQPKTAVTFLEVVIETFL